MGNQPNSKFGIRLANKDSELSLVPITRELMVLLLRMIQNLKKL
jgi:hypothetical protein